MKRGKCRAGVAQENSPDFGQKGRRTGSFGKTEAVIARIGFRNRRKFTAAFPIKSAAVNDNPSDRGTVTADEFRGGMYDNIRSVINRTDQKRSGKGRINNQRNAMFVCNGSNLFDID